jgi:hypothetical protein
MPAIQLLNWQSDTASTVLFCLCQSGQLLNRKLNHCQCNYFRQVYFNTSLILVTQPALIHYTVIFVSQFTEAWSWVSGFLPPIFVRFCKPVALYGLLTVLWELRNNYFNYILIRRNFGGRGGVKSNVNTDNLRQCCTRKLCNNRSVQRNLNELYWCSMPNNS